MTDAQLLAALAAAPFVIVAITFAIGSLAISEK